MDKIRLDPETHTYYLGDIRVPSFTGICRDLGVTQENPFYTDAGREEGLALHLWLGFLVRGKVPDVPPNPRIAGRVMGIEKFISDTGFKIAGGEEAQYDPIGRFACTPDLWGFIGAWSWVIDLKRANKLPTHRLQTAAQRIALSANGFRAQKRGCLYLRDNDYRLVEHTDNNDMARWSALVNAYHIKKEYI